MDVDAAGYCPGCGTYRGTQSYETAGPASAAPYGAPYGGPSSDAPYSGAPYSGAPYSGAPYGGQQYSAPPYGGQQYQAPPQQAHGGYPDPNYPPSFAPAPPPGRRSFSTWPLILLSAVAVLLVVGIVTVVVVRSGSDENGGGTANPTTGPTAGPTDTVAAGLDKCVLGNWRVTSAREKVEIEGQLYEFTASGGTIEFRGDGTATIDYGSGVVYRTTMSGQSVTITVTGTATFSYKTVDNTITYSNMSESGQLVYRVNDTVTDTIPLDLDTSPNGYTCSGSSLTLTTDLTTTELRK
jgi:hypothetical protein